MQHSGLHGRGPAQPSGSAPGFEANFPTTEGDFDMLASKLDIHVTLILQIVESPQKISPHCTASAF